MKITCPSNNGVTPPPFAPPIHKDQINDGWYNNFFKLSEKYIYPKQYFEFLDDYPTNHSTVLLFNNEEELNIWANNCRLTDPQLIADQEMWETAHGITITYEYYSLSPTTGPDPVI